MNQKELAKHLRFLRVAKFAGESSKCKRRQIGAVLAKDQYKYIKRSNSPSLPCAECTKTTHKECPAIHAEAACVVESGHTAMYCKDLYVFSEVPCLQCLSYIKKYSGVENIYCLTPESYAPFYPAVLDPWRLDQIEERKSYAHRLGFRVFELTYPKEG